jgi:hypothetical protein
MLSVTMRVLMGSVIRPAIMISVVIPFVIAPTLGFKLTSASFKEGDGLGELGLDL